MFEIKKIVTKPNYLLNYIMPCPITTLTSSALKKTTREKNKQQNKQKQTFQDKNSISKLKSTY